MANLPRPLSEEELKRLAERQREAKDVDQETGLTAATAAAAAAAAFEQKTGRHANIFSSNGVTTVGFRSYLQDAALHAEAQRVVTPQVPAGGFPAPGITSKTILSTPVLVVEQPPQPLSDGEILKRHPEKRRQWVQAQLKGDKVTANKILAELRKSL